MRKYNITDRQKGSPQGGQALWRPFVNGKLPEGCQIGTRRRSHLRRWPRQRLNRESGLLTKAGSSQPRGPNPDWPEVVTYVLGTICHLCVRAGQSWPMAETAGCEPSIRLLTV